MKNIFTKHPHSLEETYCQHLIRAAYLGSKMVFAGLACLIHAVFPFLFTNTASTLLFQLVDSINKRTLLEKDASAHIDN